MRIETDIDLKDRLRATLSDFRGVDTSKAILDIAKTRASYMRNFINVDGVNRKRNGWEQKLQFLDSDGVPMPINGEFGFELNNTEFFIVYAGTTFYSLDENYNKTDITNSASEVLQTPNQYLLKSQRTQCFISNNKAYFIGCGDFLVFGKFNGVYELRRVRTSDETYIPTTTINGTSDDSITRKSLDDVNLATSWRKNTFYTGTGTSGNIYKLDTQLTEETKNVYDNEAHISFQTTSEERDGQPIDYGSQITVDITYYDVTEIKKTLRNKPATGATSNTKIFYGMGLGSAQIHVDDIAVWENLFARVKVGDYIQTIAYGSSNYSHSGKIIMEMGSNGYKELNVYYDNELFATVANESTGYTESYFILPSGFGTVERISNHLGYASLLFPDINFTYIIAPSAELYEYSKDIDGVETWGTTVMGAIVFDTDLGYANGNIRLDFAHGTGVSTDDNMTITFAKTGYKYSQMLTDCTIGTLFGANGNADRLFLSGNSEYKNIVFHSAQDDFTYFSDLDTQAQGSDNTAVMSFQRFTDDTLAIYKEASKQEPNLYVVSTDTQYTYDTDGNIDTMKVIFPNSGSYIAEGVTSKYAVGTIANDPLILGNKGVYGVELSTNVTSQERFTKERSRPVYALLKNLDLANAIATTHDNRYYLFAGEKCFIADSRYQFSLDKDMDDTFSYEWWVWDNMPIRTVSIIDNVMWFGTEDGRLCKFDDKFTDRTYDTTFAGELTFSFSTSKFTYNQSISALDLQNNDVVRFTTDLYTQYFDTDAAGYSVSDGKIVCPESLITTLIEGTKVYADNVTDTGLSVDTAYYISDIDIGNCTFTLRTASGTLVTVTATGFRLCKNLKGVNVYLTNVDIVNHTFQIKTTIDGSQTGISPYNDTTPTGLIMDFCGIENVIAEWYTGAFDFGASDYSKSLLGITVVSDQTVNSTISVGYETRSILGLLNNNRGSFKEQRTPSFDLSNLDFEEFSFESAFTRAYTKKLKVRNFNHIMFVFKSEDDKDCAIYSLTIKYKINRTNKGVN